MAESQQRLDISLRKLGFLFKCTGVNPESRKRGYASKLKYRILYYLNFIWMNTDAIGGVFWVIGAIENEKTFTSITYIAPCIILSGVADLKSISIIFYEDNILNLMKDIRKLEEDEKNHEQTSEKYKIINTELIFLNKVIKLNKILYVVLVLAFALSPLVLILIKYIKTGEIELILPFLIVYPFDPFQMKYWPFVYLRQFWSESVVVMYTCVTDFMFYICCIHIRIQFKLLSHDIQGIITNNNKFNILVNDEEFHDKFVSLVKWHQRIIDAVNTLETIYSKSTLYNFLSSSIIICLTGFNATTQSDVAFIFTFMSFLFTSLVQIYFLCLFGDVVMEASMEVSDAVYQSRWYTEDPATANMLLLMLIRAQKPCKFTAYGFAEVNLRAFTKVLSTSWSYFALLKTVYSTQRS